MNIYKNNKIKQRAQKITSLKPQSNLQTPYLPTSFCLLQPTQTFTEPQKTTHIFNNKVKHKQPITQNIHIMQDSMFYKHMGID